MPHPPPTDRPDPGPTGFARFLVRAVRLKSLPRTGWLDRGVPPAETESVAAHSFGVALLAWLAAHAAADPALDPGRVLVLALLHDLAETVTGDATPYDPAALPSEDPGARRAFLDRRHRRDPERTTAKRAAEASAMTDLLADLPPSLARTVDAVWRELADGESAAARFVKEADTLETFLQSRVYLAGDADLPMASFAAEVAEVVSHPTLAALRDAIASPPAEAPGEPPSLGTNGSK